MVEGRELKERREGEKGGGKGGGKKGGKNFVDFLLKDSDSTDLN